MERERGRCERGWSRKTYVFNEGTLVLECITLTQVVQLVVEVFVDLAAGTVLDEEAAEDSEATHPEDLAAIKRVRIQLHSQ